MTNRQGFDLTTGNGSQVLIDVTRILKSTVGDRYALIGGLAINSYLEPVLTLDADFAIAADNRSDIKTAFTKAGWKCQEFPHSLNVERPGTKLSIQFSFEDFYQSYSERSETRDVFGVPMRVATLEDVLAGKIKAALEPTRRASKVIKDQADITRIIENYPKLSETVPWDELNTAVLNAAKRARSVKH